MDHRPPIVLVHGAWGGAWIWRRVLGPLRAAGHEVHAVTLTGDGERAHLRRPDIGLATHVADVVGLIEAEELQGCVLVGHSYGGIVITAAAEAILTQGQAGVLRGLVYVDAAVPEPGDSWSSGHAPQTLAQREALAAAHDNALPPADPALFGLAGADRDWLLRRQVPHPFGMYCEPVQFSAERLAMLPRLFVDCTSPALATIDASRRRVRAQPGWRVVEIATGHCPMVSRPDELVRRLLDFAGGR
ncbi:MAG: esterase [Pseudomonadota bacterium]|nr:alpha/beta hydrolase [Rubrivivax sp.]NLZ42245.1 alpha/beta hydrolase [Comamonadaceae bacterium]